MFNNEEVFKDTIPMLWHKIYRVKVPELAVKNDAEIALFGTYITDNKEIDDKLVNKSVIAWHTIISMINMYEEGHTVVIPSPNDVIEIYDVISLHLYKWKHVIDTSINLREIPVEDLILMDDFNNNLFSYAKSNIISNNETSNVLGDINTNPLMREDGLKGLTETLDIDIERTSLSNFFKTCRTDDEYS